MGTFTKTIMRTRMRTLMKTLEDAHEGVDDGAHDEANEDGHCDDHEDVHVEDRGSDYRTWLHASLALFVISLCGVFGVIIIPIMQKIFYQHLLQFLIALGE